MAVLMLYSLGGGRDVVFDGAVDGVNKREVEAKQVRQESLALQQEAVQSLIA